MVNKKQKPISLKKAWPYYIACVVFLAALFILLLNLGVSDGAVFTILTIFYFVLGLKLNFNVLRRVTDDYLSRIKIRMTIFWPVSYPILFLSLASDQKYTKGS